MGAFDDLIPASAGAFSNLVPRREPASGVWDALVAGGQRSGTGLFFRGKLPDVVLDPHHAKWYESAIASAAEIGSDLPQAVAGALGGVAVGTATAPGVGTTLLGGAGMMAVPTAIRESLTRAYENGEADSSTDWLTRTGIMIKGMAEADVLKATGKAALVGAATLGAGKLAAPLGTLAKYGAEVGTMTVAPAALEGHLPEPQDFVNAAIVVGGMKVAGHVAGKLVNIYAKTGLEPERVVADAKRDPTIAEDLKAPAKDIPRAYQPLAAEENAHAAVPGEKAAAVAESPFAEIPQAAGEPTQPTHVNYNYTNTSAEVDGALARLSNIYEKEIQTERRSEVPREQTYAEAGDILNRLIGGEDVDVKAMRGNLATDHALGARILAKKQLAIGAAEDMMRTRDAYVREGSPEAKLQYLASIERTATILSNFLGERAEIGRALEILKSTKNDSERLRQIQQLVDTYKKDPDKLAIAMGMMDEPGAMLKAARAAIEPGKWDKFVEYVKAGWVSGPWTHAANLGGNTVFMAMRPVIEQIASAIGVLRGGERVTMMQPLARVIGNITGAFETAKLGAKIYELEGPKGVVMAGWRAGEFSQKAEASRGAISGKWGEVVRTSFRVLGAEDALFKTFNERGELYSRAAKVATDEGLSPLSREYWNRVGDLVSNPTEADLSAAKSAGLRLTFNMPLGEMGKAGQQFIRAWNLQLLAPFTQTPGNIAKEMIRLTPFAPFIKEWREAYAEGGAARDKAIAELAVGSALMGGTVALFMAGKITGASDPKKGKRNVSEAAGVQPYSVEIDGKWYDYSRLQPVGTMIGLAADVATAWDKMDTLEQDQVPKILATGFANAITNQTMLQGLTMFVRALSEPAQFFPRMAQSYTASLLPFSGLMRQTAEVIDTQQRRVDSIKDAVWNAVPKLRETLLPKLNVLTGEPLEVKERTLGQKTVAEAQDKVLSEADRLGLSVPGAPNKLHIGRATGKIGDVPLTPEQQNKFIEATGKLAHQILTPLVASPAWDGMKDAAKKQIYKKVFARARKMGAAMALPGEDRAALAQGIADQFVEQLE